MLKHLLISPLVLLPLWTFQISSQIITMSDSSDTLMMCGFEATMILLKIWLFLMIDSTILVKMGVLVFSNR